MKKAKYSISVTFYYDGVIEIDDDDFENINKTRDKNESRACELIASLIDLDQHSDFAYDLVHEFEEELSD